MGKTVSIGLIIISLVIGIGYWISSASENAEEKREKLTQLIGTTDITVVASSTCGCCKLYAGYLEGEGFDVDLQLKSQSEVESFKTENGIPSELWSCHTSKIGDYII